MFGLPIGTALAVGGVLVIGIVLSLIYAFAFNKSEDWWTF